MFNLTKSTEMGTLEKVLIGGLGGLLAGVSFGVLSNAGHEVLAYLTLGYMAIAIARLTEK